MKRFILSTYTMFVIIMLCLSIFSGFHLLPEEVFAETTKSNTTTTISINKKKMTLYVGQSKKLKATVEGTDEKPTWSVSKKGIVKVSKGKVTALKAGKVKVTVKVNNKKVSCVVTVKNPAISLDYESVTLYESEKITLHATVKGKSQTTTWKSSNKSVATVSNNGEVTAVGKGTAVITAKANGLKTTCNVTVKEKESLTLNTSSVSIEEGKTYKLMATITGLEGNVKWTSSNEIVATVNDGTVKAIKKGTATITASCGGKEADCIIKVIEDSLISASEKSDGDIVTKILEYYKAGKYSKADELAGKLKQYADEKCVSAMSLKVKKAYLSEINSYTSMMGIVGSMNHPEYVWDYYLTDIDNDRIPELLIKYGSCEANVRTNVFTFKSNKVLEIGQFYCGHGTFFAYPNNNGLVVIYAHMGEESVSVITLNNGKLIETSYGSRNKRTNSSGYLPMGLLLKGHKQYDTDGTWRLDTADLTVEEDKSISLNKNEMVMTTGEKETLTATCKNINGAKWKSSNKNVATVSKSGEVLAVGKGTAVITTYLGSYKAECIVTVFEKNLPYTENIEAGKKYTNLDFDNDGKVDEFVFRQKVLTEDGHKIKFILNGKTNEVNVGPHGAEVLYYKYNTDNIYLFVFSWYASSNELFIYRYNNGSLSEVNAIDMLCGLYFKSAKGKSVQIETRIIKMSHVHAFSSFSYDYNTICDDLKFTANLKLNTAKHSFTLASPYAKINENAYLTYKGATFTTSSSPKQINQNGLVLQPGMTVKVIKIYMIPYVQIGSPSCEVYFCVENNGVKGWFNEGECFE